MKWLRYQFWYLSIMLWVGILSWVPGIQLVSEGRASAWWFALTAIAYFFWTTCTTVGYHRYFAHRMFRCRPFWDRLLAIGGALFWNGSVIQWVAAHITHHKYHDTPRDPQYTGWSYLFWKRYRSVQVDLRSIREYARDPLHLFIHNYYLAVVLGFMAALYLLSPMILLYGYLMPFGLFRVIGGIHTVIAHYGDGKRKYPIDLPWLEYVLPLMGEWNHGLHHQHWQQWNMRYRWWHIDPGAWVIRAIRI
ncbi:MAG TPA: fatty acid desaturase [Steroidobacter sp.]